MVQATCEFTVIETLGTSVSGVFVCVRILAGLPALDPECGSSGVPQATGERACYGKADSPESGIDNWLAQRFGNALGFCSGGALCQPAWSACLLTWTILS